MEKERDEAKQEAKVACVVANATSDSRQGRRRTWLGSKKPWRLWRRASAKWRLRLPA